MGLRGFGVFLVFAVGSVSAAAPVTSSDLILSTPYLRYILSTEEGREFVRDFEFPPGTMIPSYAGARADALIEGIQSGKLATEVIHRILKKAEGLIAVHFLFGNPEHLHPNLYERYFIDNWITPYLLTGTGVSERVPRGLSPRRKKAVRAYLDGLSLDDTEPEEEVIRPTKNLLKTLGVQFEETEYEGNWTARFLPEGNAPINHLAKQLEGRGVNLAYSPRALTSFEAGALWEDTPPTIYVGNNWYINPYSSIFRHEEVHMHSYLVRTKMRGKTSRLFVEITPKIPEIDHLKFAASREELLTYPVEARVEAIEYLQKRNRSAFDRARGTLSVLWYVSGIQDEMANRALKILAAGPSVTVRPNAYFRTADLVLNHPDLDVTATVLGDDPGLSAPLELMRKRVEDFEKLARELNVQSWQAMKAIERDSARPSELVQMISEPYYTALGPSRSLIDRPVPAQECEEALQPED